MKKNMTTLCGLAMALRAAQPTTNFISNRDMLDMSLSDLLANRARADIPTSVPGCVPTRDESCQSAPKRDPDNRGERGEHPGRDNDPDTPGCQNSSGRGLP